MGEGATSVLNSCVAGGHPRPRGDSAKQDSQWPDSAL